MTLIFDYDGTLHNTVKLYGTAVRAVLPALEKLGHAAPSAVSDEALSKYLGMTAGEMWRDFMPELPESEARRAASLVGQKMTDCIENGLAQLYDGIPEALDELSGSGARCVILSNCTKAYLEAHREHLGLDRWFSGYYPAEAFEYISKSAIVPKIMKDFPDTGYIIIGDRASDIEAAAENGLPCIGCSYGCGAPGELAGSSAVISSPNELPAAVMQISTLFNTHTYPHERSFTT